MTEFAFKMMIIFTPGIIARFLLGRFIIFQTMDRFYFVLQAFILGLASYLIYDVFSVLLRNLVAYLKQVNIEELTALPTISQLYSHTQAALPISTIFCSAIIAVILAFVLAFTEKKHFLLRTARKLKCTNRFSESTVWDHLFNSEDIHKYPWVVVRNRAANLMYQGRVAAYSDSISTPELLLEDVEVFTCQKAQKLYRVSSLYLTLSKNDLDIECMPVLREITKTPKGGFG